MKNNLCRFSHLALGILLCISLCGCILRPYRFPLKQGNEIGPESIAQIQIGMTADEVRYILGSPMLQDAFHETRWDYVYMSRKGYEPFERYHVAIFFQNDCVSQIVQDAVPTVAKAKEASAKEAIAENKEPFKEAIAESKEDAQQKIAQTKETPSVMMKADSSATA